MNTVKNKVPVIQLKKTDFPDDKIPRLENWGINKQVDCAVGNIYDSPNFTDGTRIVLSGKPRIIGNAFLETCKGALYVLGRRK